MTEPDWLEPLERGEDPSVMMRMRSGWAVLGSTQHLPGYCLLIHADRGTDHLTDLSPERRTEFLEDLAVLGEAVEQVCSARDPQFYRVNYLVAGNRWNHLHGHVHARYHWEPEDRRTSTVWSYGDERKATRYRLDLGTAHRSLHQDLSSTLRSLTAAR